MKRRWGWTSYTWLPSWKMTWHQSLPETRQWHLFKIHCTLFLFCIYSKNLNFEVTKKRLPSCRHPLGWYAWPLLLSLPCWKIDKLLMLVNFTLLRLPRVLWLWPYLRSFFGVLLWYQCFVDLRHLQGPFPGDKMNHRKIKKSSLFLTVSLICLLLHLGRDWDLLPLPSVWTEMFKK